MAASGNVRYSQLRSGDRSGNGSKVATVTGTLTTGKQLEFDAFGNIVASAEDIGAGGGSGSGELTPPTDSGFSWVNQGSATISSSDLGLLLVAPGSATPNHRVRVKTLPSAPYTITAAFSCFGKAVNYGIAGIYLRDSASGKLAVFGVGWANPGISGVAIGFGASKWNSPTSYNSDYTVPQVMTHGESPFWLQVADDSTNRKVYLVLGGDTTNRIELLSTTRTDFLTPDEYGFGCNSENSTTCGIYLKSLVVS